VVNGKTKEIIDVRQGKGKEHDFNLFKRTLWGQVHEEMPVYADLGYLGIDAYHANSKIPKKASSSFKQQRLGAQQAACSEEGYR